MAENNNYPDTVDSRSVDIIETIINQEEYDIPPQSRLEEVLLELKEAIAQGGGGNVYVTTTPLTDGATTNPITVNGESVTVDTGDIAVYNHKEFIWDGSSWDELGDLSGLGEMAFLNRSDMGELAFEDASDLNLGELATKDADDIHKEISDVDYAALTTEQKNNGTEYFVYETEEDNRTITAYDSNGDFLYTLTMYGGCASDIGLDSKVTTPPTIVAPNPYGSGGFIFKGTFADGNTYYFNGVFTNDRTGYSVANYSERIADAYGTNLFFVVNGNRFTLMSAPNVAWISSIHIPGYDESSFEYGAVATGNRYIKAYDKSYGDVTIDPTPTQGSSNAVSSGGVYTALQGVFPVDYSTTEQNTGRKWIDGKPIYQKVVLLYNNGSLVSGLTINNKIISGSTIPTNIDTLIDYHGISERGGSGDAGYVDNYAGMGTYSYFSHTMVPNIANNTIYFDPYSAVADVFIVYEYTKTTDTVE